MRHLTTTLLLTCLIAAGTLRAAEADCARWASVARRAAVEGIVLLKNDRETLPVKTPATFRYHATDEFMICGEGSAIVQTDRVETIPEGLCASGLRQIKSGRASLGVVLIVRRASEGTDAERAQFDLSIAERDLIREAAASAERVVVIVNAGHPINLRPLKDDPKVGAILYCWFPGQEGSAALADLILGRENPSGRLADTLAEKLTDYPSDATFHAYAYNLPYTEGSDVGYRYFNRKAPKAIVYPFGFGLSYTRFSESAVLPDGTNGLRCVVKNIGTCPGRHSVLHFVDGELAAFGKSRVLKPDESEKITLHPFVRGAVKRYPQETEPNDPAIDALMSHLSPEEKLNLCSAQPSTTPFGTGGLGNLLERGIPNPQTVDGPNGIRRSGASTCFPVLALLAQTFNEELAFEVGRALGEEALSWKTDILLGPGLNIHRHPLCGRNFEYFSEDPLVSGKMAAAYVRGVQSTGVAATLKHFCCNSREWNRLDYSSDIDERTLRDLYLKGFEIAVREGRPRCVMTAYNRINGTPAGECGWLINGILRGEWGFDGLVMSDWRAKSEIARQIPAGCDVYMPYGYPEKVNLARDMLRGGLLSMSDVDACARRVLREVMRSRRYREGDLGPVVKIPPEGTTEIPARDMNNVSSTWTHGVQDPVEGWCHSGLGRDPRGNDTFVEYVLDVEKAGDYTLTVRARTSDLKAHLSVATGAFESEAAGFATTNVWTTFRPVRMPLPTGLARVKIWMRQATERGFKSEPCVTLGRISITPAKQNGQSPEL